MSAFAGVYEFDRRPLAATRYSGFAPALKRYGPDGGGNACLQSVGMWYRALCTTPECDPRQPLRNDDDILLTWDGRLDNRSELLARLDPSASTLDDAAVVLRIYLAVGESFVRLLIGDFALALFDKRVNRLLLARDPFGVRTLYYHVTPERIAWATHVGPLMEGVGLSGVVDEDYVEEYFAYWPSLHRTPFRGVSAVVPGQVIAVTPDTSLRTTTFWSIEQATPVRYASDTDYEEHFRLLFKEAVETRLRGPQPVFAELSGGLDSSCIVCMAREIVKNGVCGVPNVHTVSRICDVSPSSSEGKWVRHVDSFTGFPSHHVLESEYPTLNTGAPTFECWIPAYRLMSADADLATLSEMRAVGSRVLLSGMGGDELLHSVSDPEPLLADLCATWQFRSLHRELVRWGDLLHRSYADLFINSAFRPALPRAVRRRLRKGTMPLMPAWLTATFESRVRTRFRMQWTDALSNGLPSARYQARGLRGVMRSIATGARRDQDGLEVTYPYLHRPLVEFLQGVPFDQKLRPGETRSLQRRALRTLLPAPILRRKGKGDVNEQNLRVVGASLPRLQQLFQTARVCDRGYVDLARIQATLAQANAGVPIHMVGLYRTLILENWLRGLERRSLQDTALNDPEGQCLAV